MPLHFHNGVLKDNAAQHRVGNLLAAHLAAANLLGRVQIVKHVQRKTGKHLPVDGASRLHRARFDDSTEAPDDGFSVGFDTNLPAEDIAGFLRSLTPVTKDIFDGLSAQYRRDAFTLAGVSDQRLIQRVRDELARLALSGGTEAEFEAAVNKMTTEAGVEAINAFTLDTAFQTAMQKAYSLGRYEQMKAPAVKDVLPVWQYWTVGDAAVRPEHRVIHGFAALADDPVWLKIYPPNGFNCRCAVVPLLASEAPKDAMEPGYARLPMLAKLKVPQAGFGKVFAA